MKLIQLFDFLLSQNHSDVVKVASDNKARDDNVFGIWKVSQNLLFINMSENFSSTSLLI